MCKQGMQRDSARERESCEFKEGEGQGPLENEWLGREPAKNSENKILVGRMCEAYLKQHEGICVWNRRSKGECRWRYV